MLVSGIDEDAVQVTWDSRAETREGLAEEGYGIARVVWEKARFRVDAVALTPEGVNVPGGDAGYPQWIPREELEQRFGPRDPALDARTFADGIDMGPVVAVLAGLAVLGVAAIVLIVVLVRRTKRRNQPPPGAWAPQPGAWGQPGWQQPPPGSWGPPPAAPPGTWGPPPPAAPPGAWGPPPPAAPPGAWGPPPPAAPPAAPPPRAGSPDDPFAAPPS